MTTVTSLTADRMLAIEAASVVDGDVISGNLILTKHDGSQINAGPVTGPTGPQGPQGALLPVISGVPVLDVGLINQIRAGRQLTAADFTNMGLSAPAGLWNLSDLSDVSGNGRNLLNKGAVPFDIGINGTAATAAKFIGNNTQALYISDTGASDPFRIKTGSIGCWFRATKNNGYLVSKYGLANNYSWLLYTHSANTFACLICSTGVIGTQGTDYQVITGLTNIVDDRWHFGVITIDGNIIRLYLDGNQEASSNFGMPFSGASPLNIGASGGDASTNAGAPHTGRIDEVFITSDVLSEDQIRNLYCTKISHTLAAVPSRVSMNVHRKRKGATLAVADFPTQPLRLHNFSGGSVGDEGSGGVGLSLAGSPLPSSVAGVDGSAGNAFNFTTGAAAFSTDVGLPLALTSRSYGCWFKTGFTTGFMTLLQWGLDSSNAHAAIYFNAGNVSFVSGTDAIVGPFMADGQWHFVVVSEDNAAADGIKRKLYVDGRLVAQSTVLNSITSGGNNYMRIGLSPLGGTPFVGQADSVFICNYVLTPERIAQLYAKSLMTLASSPKNPGDHVEAMSSSNLLATFDTLESQHTIDLGVEP